MTQIIQIICPSCVLKGDIPFSTSKVIPHYYLRVVCAQTVGTLTTGLIACWCRRRVCHFMRDFRVPCIERFLDKALRVLLRRGSFCFVSRGGLLSLHFVHWSFYNGIHFWGGQALGIRLRRSHTGDRSSISSAWSRSFRADRCIPDLYDLYDLYDVAGWEPYDLHDLAHSSWVGPGPVQYIS